LPDNCVWHEAKEKACSSRGDTRMQQIKERELGLVKVTPAAEKTVVEKHFEKVRALVLPEKLPNRIKTYNSRLVRSS
jgi:hypothetical protein